MQVFGEAKGPLHALVGDLELLVEIHLAAVGLVGNADHVGAIGQQLGVLGELVNGGEKDPAAVAALQELAQMIAALHTLDCLIPDVALSVSEQLGKLPIQIGTIGDQNDGRAGEIHALHPQPCQEEHRKTLAAAGRAEVGAALAVAFRLPVLKDVPIQFRRRVVLRVAAEDLCLRPGDIGEMDEVSNDVEEGLLVEQTVDHRVKALDSISVFV